MKTAANYNNIYYKGSKQGILISRIGDGDDASWITIYADEHRRPIVDIKPHRYDIVFTLAETKSAPSQVIYFDLAQKKAIPIEPRNNKIALADAITQRVIVLDGAMGTMIQRQGLTEDDFRGDVFVDWQCRLTGCNDVLALTSPDVIRSIHEQYLDAGADIIETNTFNANPVSLADYDSDEMHCMVDYMPEINVAASRLARDVADRFMERHPERQCWVAGSVGPTSKSLTMSAGIDGSEGVVWDDLEAGYLSQMTALIAGGVDLLLIETIFDGLNAKVALHAAREAMRRTGITLPIVVSVTLTESGRTLSGQTLDAFVVSVSHAKPLAVGLNCGFGADGMMTHLENLRSVNMAVSVYPNAGLPNEMGEYDQTPEQMADKVAVMLERRLVNIVGGCCGTTPEHIKAIADMAKTAKPREIPDLKASEMILAGLEPLEVSRRCNFMNVGERCNVAGSRKFLRLIKEGNLDEAVDIARKQVEAGAQVIDVNMDDAMLDAPVEMSRFVSRLAVEPEVARVPLMIDSSNWEAILAGLKSIQGRPIVNSISLKEGEDAFVRKAECVKKMGAAVVVMAFDEQGQADTFERRIDVCRRAYELLTERVGMNGCDIVFDPNVLAVATGIDAHADYALDFIRAVEWIKHNLPGAKVSGGVSNLSFSFRGNNYVREAMHSVFLYHAIAKGLDMAIVNAATMIPIGDVPEDLRWAIEDVLFNRRPDATERLVEIAECIKCSKEEEHNVLDAKMQLLTPSEQLENMLVKGLTEGMEELLPSVMAECGSAVAVIDGPLMAGMNKVGELFGSGKMFLPQVVKTARTMKHAVAWLTPFIEEEKSKTGVVSSGKMIIATVKGDVHDIGKNIVGVIMNCNGYEVVDLGVMVPGETIVERAIAEQADFIGLSGLITPSLEEMCHVARLMEAHGMKIPLLIGGATTSAMHTAVKIAPCYSGAVVYTRDVALLPLVAQKLYNVSTREAAIKDIKEEQKRLRFIYKHGNERMHILEKARGLRPELCYTDMTPKYPGLHDMNVNVSEARDYINWRVFFATWKLDASFASIAEVKGCDHCRAQWLASMSTKTIGKASEAMQLWEDAQVALDYLQRNDMALKARVVITPAVGRGDDIVCRYDNVELVLPMMRQQLESSSPCLCLADFLKPENASMEKDWLGLFAVTIGEPINNIVKQWQTDGDDYKALLYQSLADRLVEAATEVVHRVVRRELWAYAQDESENPGNRLLQYYQGIRPAIGYPSLSDQSLIFETDKILHYADMGIVITEHGAMNPSSSTTGLMFAHPYSRYFVLGPIGNDQLIDYARRRNVEVEDIIKFLPN